MHKVTLFFFSTLAVLTLSTATASADRGADNSHGPGTAANNITNVTTVGQGFIADGISNASAHSTAQFEVKPGDLTLDHVPNLNLSTAKVADIINGDVTVNYTDNTVNSANNFDGNNNGKLDIADYTGSNNGWKLMTSLGQFKNAKSSDIIANAKLALNATSSKGDSDVAKPDAVTLTASSANDNGTGTQETAIWTATKNTGQGFNEALYADTKSASLTISKQTNVATGVYQGTLYWNLVNVPTANAPKA